MDKGLFLIGLYLLFSFFSIGISSKFKIPVLLLFLLLGILSGSEGLNYPSITELFKNKIQGHRSFYKDTSNFNTFLDKL